MKLFWRIFLCFWLAAILMFAVVIGVNEALPFTFPGDGQTRFEPEAAQPILVNAVNVYETKGALPSSLENLERPVYLVDQDGRVLAGGPTRLFYPVLTRYVLRSGHAAFQKYFGLRALYLCPVQSASGRRYAAVLTLFDATTRLSNARFWFNVLIATVSTALVCMALSLYLTRPITRLRTTAQQLASGDLNARAGHPARGDELGDLAREFDAMAAQIQRLMTAQRRFVADVSHELGAPLTRMHLALALLRRQIADKNSGELGRIEREADKLSNLVQQLLLLAALEVGGCPAETLTPVPLRPLCESIVEDAAFEAQHANCIVDGERQEVTVLAYPQLLRRAIDNVLRNAIRYAPQGTDVLLTCAVSHDSQYVTVEVLDSGPGVPESMLDDIFKPFYRTDPGRDSSSGGTGLGLAIAAEAIRLHGGVISARNRESGGLQVTIQLAARIPATETDAGLSPASAYQGFPRVDRVC
jgi:two-component system, OmpR family, sensor histidine kinase CpxA